MLNSRRLRYLVYIVATVTFCKSLYSYIYPTPRYAFATFLSTRLTNESVDDPYFTATRVLAYQILHNPETRTRQKTPFLVLVLPHVSEAKRKILREEGATVVPVELIQPRHWTPFPGAERWIDQFAKLQLFSLTQYDRIVYMDNDVLVTRPFDEIWKEDMVVNPQKTKYESFNAKQEYTNARVLPKEYVFAGVVDYEGPGGGPILFQSHPRLNGGFFVIKPDNDLLAYYLSILNHDKVLFDETLMEQALLNYAHRAEGPIPWIPLPPRRYCSNYPRLADLEAGSALLHDKFWWYQDKPWIDRELVDMWWHVQGKMEGYWQRKDESKQNKQIDHSWYH